jgi:hypothetical protein
VAQYVVLGAGLDTFACRNPHSTNLRVFEVDHPATQAWKLERLQAAGIAIPQSLKFAPVDFRAADTGGRTRTGRLRLRLARVLLLAGSDALPHPGILLGDSGFHRAPASGQWRGLRLRCRPQITQPTAAPCAAPDIRAAGGRLRASLSNDSSVPPNWPGNSGTWDFNAPKYWEWKK